MKVELRQIPQPGARQIAEMIKAGAMQHFAAYEATIVGDRFSGRYAAFLSRDNLSHGMTREPDWRWHISIAGEHDVPRWAHLVAIAHKLRPGVVFVVGVPPESHWMNIAEHCLHCWQLEDKALADQWRAERQGHRPS